MTHPSRLLTSRRQLLLGSLTTATLTALSLAGCGGGGGEKGSDRAEITTGGTGSFNGIRIGPSAGSTYISSGTTFQIAWPLATAPPPPQFTAELHRYKEARGGETRLDERQKVVASRVGSTAAWNISRANNFTLDTDGVYYLSVTASGQPEQLAAYIVASGRAESLPASGRAVDTGQNGRLQDVQITPTPGAVFLPKATTFRLTWPAGAPPPPQFDVKLVRYQEARGSADRNVSTQIINITDTGVDSEFSWNVKRRDNFDLDQGGVYYLEITAPGENPVRAAYIVSTER